LRPRPRTHEPRRHIETAENVHVAALAGVPDPVVERSREVLQRLRDDEAIDVRGSEDEATGESKRAVFDLGGGVVPGAGLRRRWRG
jgi:hypothetical protein